jgi:hypothetical protein
MLQAAILECVPFDPYSFQENGLTAPKIHVGWRQLTQAFVVASVIVVARKYILGLKPATRLEFE